MKTYRVTHSDEAGFRTKKLPWTNRKPNKPKRVRNFKREMNGEVKLYTQFDNGSIQRIDSDREIRKVLGLSPRQYRKQKRLAKLAS